MTKHPRLSNISETTKFYLQRPYRPFLWKTPEDSSFPWEIEWYDPTPGVMYFRSHSFSSFQDAVYWLIRNEGK